MTHAIKAPTRGPTQKIQYWWKVLLTTAGPNPLAGLTLHEQHDELGTQLMSIVNNVRMHMHAVVMQGTPQLLPSWDQLVSLPASIHWNGYQVTDKQDQPNSQWCKNLQQHCMCYNMWQQQKQFLLYERAQNQQHFDGIHSPCGHNAKYGQDQDKHTCILMVEVVWTESVAAMTVKTNTNL